MTDRADPAKLHTSVEPYLPGSRPIRSELSSEAEAVFYAMATLVKRIESGGADNHAKDVAVPDPHHAEIAPRATARAEEFEKPAPNEQAPRSRIGASLLLTGFMGGALLGWVLLTQGISLAAITDGLLAEHQTQAIPPRIAENIPAHPQPGSEQRSKFLVQIGSFKSQTEAFAAWSAFTRDHPDAGAHKPDIKTVDLGEMGIWHRLRLGNFADKRAASLFCEQLKSDGEACLLGR